MAPGQQRACAESQPGAGFTTVITLSLPQSIVRALLVDMTGETYVLPIPNLELVLWTRYAAAQMRTHGYWWKLDCILLIDNGMMSKNHLRWGVGYG